MAEGLYDALANTLADVKAESLLDDNLAEEQVNTQDWPVSLTDIGPKRLIEALADTLAEQNVETSDDNWLLKKPRHQSKSLVNTLSKHRNRNTNPTLVKLKTQAPVDVKADMPTRLKEMEAETLRKRQAKLMLRHLLIL